MNNADMPAMPTHDVFEHCGFDGNSGPHMTQTTNYGLTKREMMAMHMMAACQAKADSFYKTFDDMADDAVNMADSLLSKLERTCRKT